MAIQNIINNGNIIKIILYFEDDNFIILDKLTKYEFDLYDRGLSSIEITNYFVDTEILSRFCNSTDYIKQINFTVADIEDKENQDVITLRCDMYIKNFTINGSVNSVTEMRLELEGMVKHNGER